jgi:serine/threonine protein kinase
MVSHSHLYCVQCGAANLPRANFCVVCGHALQRDSSRPLPVVLAAPKLPSSPAATPPLVLSPILKQRYRILSQIGKGGFGEVYKAADSQFGGRLVAIKSMSLDGLGPQEAASVANAFEREAFMLANLLHPNLTAIYDFFCEQQRWYLVMSFIDGTTLEEYLRARGGRLPVEKVLPIGIQLCSVLSYLHKRAIIFRDLKPANVMRTPDRQLYLIDFGVARLFKHGQQRDTVALGSPGYAAPEQYGRAQTTPQTDIYSLGATLHYLLSGVDPSDAPFSFEPLHIPAYPELGSLIQCMVERDVRQRPASMSVVKQELQRIALGRSNEQMQANTLHFASKRAVNQVVPGIKHLFLQNLHGQKI